MSAHSDRAHQYARDVVAGRIIACRWVKLACKRHLDDLASESHDFPYRFDADAADRVCEFVELMPHVKGKWRGTTMTLEPWQCFLVCVVFGWVHAKTGLRRFRRVYQEVPRKNGKSSLVAALGLYMFTEDGEPGPEVYSGAGSEKQAWEVFGPARQMAKLMPPLQAHYGVDVNAKTLARVDANGKFEPVIGKPGDGSSPSFAITDEYHEHATSEQYDTMVTGMGAREQPMAWVVTTAGSDTSGPCYDLRQTCTAMLEGKIEDPELFALIHTIDEGDDWTSVEALEKANPNMGVSVFRDYLLAQQRDAINNPRKQVTFRTKHLNVWETAASPYFNAERWRRLADESLRIEDFAGEECWKGVDLASKLDLAADVTLFRREIDGAEHWYAFLRPYLPESRAEDAENRHYAGWSAEGALVLTPGDITDYAYIEADIRSDFDRFDVRQLGFDPHNATYLMTRLMDEYGEERVVEVPQTVTHLSEPMKEVQALIEDGRLHHDGNPVFAWAIGNVTAKEDRNENVFPRKERRENKIDPAVALIIAMGRAMHAEPAADPSIFFVG